MEHFERRVDPRRHVYYWLAEINARPALDPATDYGSWPRAMSPSPPIHHDLTNYRSLNELSALKWE